MLPTECLSADALIAFIDTVGFTVDFLNSEIIKLTGSEGQFFIWSWSNDHNAFCITQSWEG